MRCIDMESKQVLEVYKNFAVIGVSKDHDKYGYKIANGREYVQPAKNGSAHTNATDQRMFFSVFILLLV